MDIYLGWELQMPTEPALPTSDSFEAIDTQSRTLRPQLQGHQCSLCTTRLRMELHMLGQTYLKAPPISWSLFVTLPCTPCPWMPSLGYCTSCLILLGLLQLTDSTEKHHSNRKL